MPRVSAAKDIDPDGLPQVIKCCLSFLTGLLELNTGLLRFNTGLLRFNTGLLRFNTGLLRFNTRLLRLILGPLLCFLELGLLLFQPVV